jgi:hypothetical protein
MVHSSRRRNELGTDRRSFLSVDFRMASEDDSLAILFSLSEESNSS